MMKTGILSMFFLVFIVFQVFFTCKGVETFPFLNYGMYSAPVNKPDSIELLRLRINGKDCDLSHLNHISEVYLQYNLHYYKNWAENDYISNVEATIRSRFEGRLSDAILQGWIRQLCNAPKQEKAFGNWLAAYLQPAWGEAITQIELISRFYESQKPYKPLSEHVRPLYPTR